MPVKDGLQDMLGCTKQIAEIKWSYRKNVTEEGEITAVVYFGDVSWDGPRSLFEMLDVRDERLDRFLSNYKLNLISSADMQEDEFETFRTEPGYAMKLLKHQSEDADELIIREGHSKICVETASFLNAAMKLNLEYEVEPGVSICAKRWRNVTRERRSRVQSECSVRMRLRTGLS